MTERRRRKITEQADSVSKAIEKKSSQSKRKGKEKVGYLSSGSSLLNLALSNNIYGGYRLGTVVHKVGDNDTSKSLLALCQMAEASHDIKFDKYHLVYEEPEAAMHFPLEDMFGEVTAKRIEFIPERGKKKQKPRTVQDWHDDLITHDTPFIWITDSFDSLSSEEDLKQSAPTKGGWRTEKPIVASQLFPKMVRKIENSQSLFTWISQTRQKMGVTFGNPKTFNGGEAITFYRAYEIWLAKAEKIYQEVRGKKIHVGNWIIAKVNKNKFTGKKRIVSFPVYDDGRGIDDLESMITWLVDYKFWETKRGEGRGGPKIVVTEEPFIDGKISEIIKHIEENNLEDKLKEIVQECWLELEKEIRPDRKKKYE